MISWLTTSRRLLISWLTISRRLVISWLTTSRRPVSSWLTTSRRLGITWLTQSRGLGISWLTIGCRQKFEQLIEASFALLLVFLSDLERLWLDVWLLVMGCYQASQLVGLLRHPTKTSRIVGLRR